MGEIERVEAIEPRRVPPPRATALDRAIGILRWMARRILRLAALALAGGVLVWWAVYLSVPEADRLIVLALLGILLLAPPLILGLLGFAVGGLAGLPGRLREAPGVTRERIVEARRRLAEVGVARRRGLFSGLGALARLGWTLRSSREVLDVAGPAAVFLTPGMMIATVVSLVAALAEVLAGLVALVWLVV
ncbi:MAG TPA: hypothetical protein VFZ45_07215 [Actinomycetota bacterium]|nr:hypothetical protein [Actinomycetota bacterium]